MAPNRITRGGSMRRARALAALETALPRPLTATPLAAAPLLAVAAVFLAAAALLAGCGGGSTSTTASTAAIAKPKPSPEESADAAILNTVLSRQEAVVDAFAAEIPHLSAPNARMASYFRAQEQEHVDAVLEALRGLKRSAAEPKAETIELPDAKGETERLVFLYEVESVSIEDELKAIAALEAATPRTVLAATVANQAQHLVLLRRVLGAGPLAQVPGPFESGAAPPPGEGTAPSP